MTPKGALVPSGFRAAGADGVRRLATLRKKQKLTGPGIIML